jgi:hypothetical protein
MRLGTLFLIAALAFPGLLAAQRRGGFAVGAGHSRLYAPSWGWYNPWFSPYYPGFYGGFYGGRYGGPALGEVKLHAPKTAEVYVDGAYAGEAGRLKSMWMRPGAYNLEVRAGGQSFTRRVYVLGGRTLKLDTELKQP